MVEQNTDAKKVNEELNKKTNFKQCPSCGAVMKFDPLTGSLKCEYCGTYKELDKTKLARNHDYNPDVEESFEKWGDVTTYKCSACGAISDLADYEMSPVCPYCGASNMLVQEDIEGLKPSGILPFKIDKDGAKLKYKGFIKKKILAPRKLRKNFKVDTVNGIYIPTFNFTTNTYSKYNGRLGKYYYVTVGSGKNRHQERRVRYFYVSGDLQKLFKNLQYEVSGHIEQKDLEKMGGFDVENALEYDTSYFAGFSSERYTESLDKTWIKATNDMKSIIKKQIINSYNADVVDYFEINTNFTEKRYQYLLVPIWKCGYKYRDKFYNFFINARNGLTFGKAPLSPIKVGILAIIGIAIVTAIVILIGKS